MTSETDKALLRSLGAEDLIRCMLADDPHAAVALRLREAAATNEEFDRVYAPEPAAPELRALADRLDPSPSTSAAVLAGEQNVRVLQQLLSMILARLAHRSAARDLAIERAMGDDVDDKLERIGNLSSVDRLISSNLATARDLARALTPLTARIGPDDDGPVVALSSVASDRTTALAVRERLVREIARYRGSDNLGRMAAAAVLDGVVMRMNLEIDGHATLPEGELIPLAITRAQREVVVDALIEYADACDAAARGFEVTLEGPVTAAVYQERRKGLRANAAAARDVLTGLVQPGG